MIGFVVRKSLNINDLRACAGKNNAEKNVGFCKMNSLYWTNEQMCICNGWKNLFLKHAEFWMSFFIFYRKCGDFL